ncbi:glucokinase-like ROK family protein [Motilibacter rhizosphaerae]|uniref:Glucokinase-like ROK family protein n=1 Tax=Motilibacter rhizosphaerae TaxID=598652 RepID=A0A4Q7NQL3_9ACTN|nr:ROK family protein [Motilibacter rhizosphaerae]RZS87513.1 glucokinase-like ROK family protein [Motilibacter rhizosphaerae]
MGRAPRPRTPLQAAALRLLRDEGPLSRAALVDALGAGRARVAAELDELVAAALVEDGGVAVSRGGRPSPLVALRGDLRFVGVDLGATSLAVAVGDSRLDLLDVVEEDCDPREGPEPVLDRIVDLVDEVTDGRGTAALGVGVPGPVSFLEGVPVSPPLLPGWNRYPVRDELARRYRCPVTVDNDVNIMAAGERWGGVAKGMDTFLLVKVGTGIGAAPVIGGSVFRGVAGSAGDIGHIRVADGPPCACGGDGCLETVFGGAALARDALRLARTGESPALAARLASSAVLTARDVGVAAAEGDPAAMALVRTGGRELGKVLAELVNFMNPSMLVLAGGVARLGHPLLAEIRQTVYRLSTPLATSSLPIVLSELDDRAGVLGALVSASDELFAVPAS